MDDSLQPLELDGVTANDKNITTNKWPIWSYEHMYTNGKPEKALADFLKYMTSDEIQSGPVKELGYLPITSMKVERAADGTDIKKGSRLNPRSFLIWQFDSKSRAKLWMTLYFDSTAQNFSVLFNDSKS